MSDRPNTPIQGLPRVADPQSIGLVTPNLAGGAQVPRLDTSAAIQPAMGMAKVGTGLEQLGNAGMELWQKKQQADSITAEYKSSELMAQARTDVASAVAAEPDQSKWGEIAEGRMGQLSNDIQQLPNVPDAAKAAITNKLSLFAIDLKGGLQRGAIDKSMRDAENSADAVISRAGVMGDKALGESTIDGMVAQKMWTPAVGEYKKTQLGVQVQKKQEQDFKTGFSSFAYADPKAAMESVDSGDFKGREEDKQWARHTAHAALGQQNQALTEELNTHVQNGDWVSPEQVDQYTKGRPEFTEAQKAGAKVAVDKLNKAAHVQWMEANSDQNTATGMAAVRAYDPKGDNDYKQYDQLNTWGHTNLVKGELEIYSNALKSKLSHPQGPAEEKDPRMKDVTTILNNMQANGEFGGFKSPAIEKIPDVNQAGDPITRTRVHDKIDTDKQAAAMTARLQTEGQLRGWMKLNPDAAVTDIKKQIEVFKSPPVRANFLDSLAPQAFLGGRFDGGALPNGQPGPVNPNRPENAPITLPQDPGRKAKEKEKEDAKEDRTPKGSADPGGAGLFPSDERGRTVGGDASMIEMPEGSEHSGDNSGEDWDIPR